MKTKNVLLVDIVKGQGQKSRGNECDGEREEVSGKEKIMLDGNGRVYRVRLCFTREG